MRHPQPLSALLQSDLPFPVRRGKVRDVYDLGGHGLLIVATDRISAFDVVMPDPIPGKGKVLTALSLFWFRRFGHRFEHHVLETDADRYPEPLRSYREQIAGRSMLVRRAQVVPIECVARGYLAGSGWKEYRQTQSVCGVKLPAGLRQADKLPSPIFTPATKEQSGHDINVSFEEASRKVGQEVMELLRERTLALYSEATEYAASRGIIIADTKFEFGVLPDGRVILIDEVLTPDSSRFWPADDYAPGREQASFDKQFLRDWLEAQNWDKRPPAPRLPPEVILGTQKRYEEAYERLAGGAAGRP